MKPRIYLIDAHAYLHRAYHALPPLTNAAKEPVGALYGFARALILILKKEKPDFIAICFDSPGPTFRHEIYKEYKATRKKIDEDLLVQLRAAPGLAEDMGFPCLAYPGYEADDLMATMASRAEQEEIDAVLVTGDKDALQMVGGGVKVLRDVNKGEWMDASGVQKKLGVSPSSVVDYLALIGDSSDNVPGVPGIGPVTAVKLIHQYGNLKRIFHAADSGDSALNPRAAHSLIKGKESASAAVRLLELKKDVPLKLKPSQCVYSQSDPGKLKSSFERLGFNSLLQEFSLEEKNGEVSTGELGKESFVFEETDLSHLKPAFKQAREIALAVSFESGDAILALALPDRRVSFLKSAEIRKHKNDLSEIFQGSALKTAYDLKEIYSFSIEMNLPQPSPAFDVRMAAYCLNPVRPREGALDKKSSWKERVFWELERALNAGSVKDRLKEEGVFHIYQDIEFPLTHVLALMEREGIGVDQPYLEKLSKEFDEKIAALQEEINREAGFPLNVNSPKQLAELLFDKLSLPVIHKTAKGGRSTDEDCLSVLAQQHPLPAKILEFREAFKLKSTYIDGLLSRIDPETGRIHTHFDQAGAETGRLSSSNPNLQNIPIRTEAGQKIRRAFIAAKNWRLVCADYSQIELRVLAHVSKDLSLKQSFAENEDIHAQTAAAIFHLPLEKVDAEMRRRAKAVNFGIVYGQTAFGLAQELQIPQAEASSIIKRYFERYHGVSRWIEQNLAEAKKEKKTRTFLGRVRYLPELDAKNAVLRQYAERAARNTPVQGAASDIIKIAMIQIARNLSAKNEFQAKMLLQIHDELVFEVPDQEVEPFSRWVKKKMENAVSLDVPLVVSVKAGRNWRDLEVIR
jgi:DNA polymerase-1